MFYATYKVIAYASRKLNMQEENVMMCDLELVVVVYALNFGDTICIVRDVNILWIIKVSNIVQPK